MFMYPKTEQVLGALYQEIGQGLGWSIPFYTFL